MRRKATFGLLWVLLGALTQGAALGNEAETDEAELNRLVAAYHDSVSNYDRDAALEYARSAYALAKATLPPSDPRLSEFARFNGAAALKRRQDVEARNQMEWAVRHALDYKKGPSPVLVEAYLGSISAQPTTRNALRAAKQARKTARKLYGETSADYIGTLVTVGVNLLNHHRTAKSLDFFDDAYALATAHLEPTEPERARVAYWRGRVEVSLERNERAIPYLNDAVSLFEAADEATSTMALSTHALLVTTYESLGQSDKATPHALSIGAASEDVGDRDVQPIYRVAPEYPKGALANGITGSVEMHLDIDTNGRVQTVTIVGGERVELFEQVSSEAVAKWRFAPRVIDGVAHERTVSVNLRFAL